MEVVKLTKAGWKRRVVLSIETDDEFAKSVLLLVYEGQTADERSGGYTLHINGIGFSSHDSEFASSLARQLEDGRQPTVRQMEHIRRLAKRYSGQVIERFREEVIA